MLVKNKISEMSLTGTLGERGWVDGGAVIAEPIDFSNRVQATLDRYCDGNIEPADMDLVDIAAEEQEYQRSVRRILRHDLLNKLTIAQGGLELFERSREDRFLEMAKRNLESCNEILGKMSSLEKPLATTELIPLDAAAIAEKVLHCHQGRGVELSVIGQGRVMADGTLFHVLENLVANALRHAAPTKVTVSIEEKGQKVLIKVADDGLGIPLDVKEKLFHEGYKFGPKGNTGLGLFIVQRIVQRYHGRIWVENNEPAGTVFCIELRGDKF